MDIHSLAYVIPWCTQLIRFLNALGRDVEIVVLARPRPGQQGYVFLSLLKTGNKTFYEWINLAWSHSRLLFCRRLLFGMMLLDCFH
jgi:hypothetical protein